MTTTMTMTTAAKAKYKRYKTKKGKIGEASRVDKKVLEAEAEAELERKFILDSFYHFRQMHNSVCIFLMGINLFLFNFVPGYRYSASVCFGLWIFSFVLSKYVSKFKGTEHEEYGKKLFLQSFNVSFAIHEILQVLDDSLASEEGRNAHASMICLTKYFIAQTMFNIASNPRFKATPFHLLEFLAQPLLVLQKPRFGIFKPKYEALAFLTALGLGSVVGSVIDEMRWRHFLVLHKNELEMKEHKRTSRRAMALEDIACCQESPFFDIIRR